MKKGDSCVLVLFGATGDLAFQKLIPALYHLHVKNKLPSDMKIIGAARQSLSNTKFQKLIKKSISGYCSKKVCPALIPKQLQSFYKRFTYTSVDFVTHDGFDTLATILTKKKCKVLYYLATSASFFPTITQELKKRNLSKNNNGWPKVIYEKPFGNNLKSAHKLNACVSSVFDEKQIFRIDHYVGKEAVQNLLVLRFANRLYEPVWNYRYIESIKITASETVGVGDRGGYYDTFGALRDMVQNHLLQLLMYTAMEPPVSLDAHDIHNEKVKVLKAITLQKARDPKKVVVRAQYQAGNKAVAYRKEKGVPNASKTETYVALKLKINNARWEGVPIYFETGKRLKKHFTEIRITFKKVPQLLFSQELAQNQLIVHIQPKQDIEILFNTQEKEILPVSMNFCHECLFGYNTPEAYEVLLHDAMRGDSTLFSRWDEVETAWKIVDPMLKAFVQNKIPLHTYKAGSEGPKHNL